MEKLLDEIKKNLELVEQLPKFAMVDKAMYAKAAMQATHVLLGEIVRRVNRLEGSQ